MTDTVRFRAVKTPFSTDFVEAQFPAGQTVRELIGVEGSFSVTVDGVPCPPEMWSVLTPRAGAIVTVCPRPRNDNVRTILLTAGLIAASVFAGPAIATALGKAGATGLLASKSFWLGSSYAVASLATQALIKPPCR